MDYESIIYKPTIDEATINNAYREAVEGNEVLSTFMKLLDEHLTELISGDNIKIDSIRLGIFVHMLQYLCKDFIREHGEEVTRRCGIKYFWTKVLDFNGTWDLSDKDMKRLTDFGSMLQYLRCDIGYAVYEGHTEDTVSLWIGEANSNYECQPDSIKSARLKKFREKWEDENRKFKDLVRSCRDQIREYSEDAPVGNADMVDAPDAVDEDIMTDGSDTMSEHSSNGMIDRDCLMGDEGAANEDFVKNESDTMDEYGTMVGGHTIVEDSICYDFGMMDGAETGDVYKSDNSIGHLI
ncbi:hypothetical protein F5X99DRAFT_414704 [Biscogniauxia marginata]|nr:hypothetical protein F5X99DRAFT_414704 [Biscogniauxia marginata]